MSILISVKCPECSHIYNDIEFIPEKVAPHSSNPSSPLYSDIGEDGEINGLPENCTECGHEFDLDQEYQTALASLDENQEPAEDDEVDDDFDAEVSDEPDEKDFEEQEEQEEQLDDIDDDEEE